MASVSAAATVKECDICCTLLNNPRVLDCDHVFCCDCLEKLERKNRIECPICKHITEIPLGMQVKHLSNVVRGENKEKSRNGRPKQEMKMINSWGVKEQISSIVVDEGHNLIYVGQYDSKSILVYTFTGRQVDTINGSGLERAPRLTFDTKRDLLVCGSGVSLRSYNGTGTCVGFVEKLAVEYISAIAYLACKDRYVIPDRGSQRVHFYDPVAEKVTRSIHAEEARLATSGGRNVSVATPRSAEYSLVATADRDKSLVKLYDGEGNFIRSYDAQGTRLDKMSSIYGVCFDYEGRILVCDSDNQRIIRISPDAEDKQKVLEVIINTEDYGYPRFLEVTSDGFIVLASYNNPFQITILGVYQ